MPYTLEQLRLLQIIQIPFAILSTIGSATIIGIIVRDWRKKTRQPYYRIMLGLSIFDVIMSTFTSLSSLPAPSGTLGAAFARGTQATCTAQGFVLAFGSAGAVFYSTSLALYYLFIIVFGKSQEWIQTHAEKYLHLVPICMALVLAIVNVPFNMYNFAGSTCWIESSPLGCSDNPKFPCQRGVEEVFKYRWLVIGWQVLVSFLTTATSMVVICLHVWKTERRMKSYDFEVNAARQSSTVSNSSGISTVSRRHAARRKSSRTRQVAIQAILYIGAMVFTWVWRYVGGIQNQVKGEIDFPIRVIDRILQPLQGLFNMLIFLRVYNKQNRGNRRAQRGNSGGTSQSLLQSSRHRVSLHVKERLASSSNCNSGGAGESFGSSTTNNANESSTGAIEEAGTSNHTEQTDVELCDIEKVESSQRDETEETPGASCQTEDMDEELACTDTVDTPIDDTATSS